MKIVDLLDRPEKWTKGTFARTNSLHSVSSLSEYATCWCLLGAASKCYNNENKGVFKPEDWPCDKLQNVISKYYPFNSVAGFNDSPNTTFDDIRKVLIEADI